MRLDSVKIAGLYGIEVPDGTVVDSEFVLSVRVRVFRMEREEIDVTIYGGDPESLPGALHADLIALDGASIDEVLA